jgi:uncharacterized membrane protein
MRIAHLVLIVAVLALGMSLTREPMGRVFVIVFLTGVGELVLALAAIMALFQTVGALGEARTLFDHCEAFLATVVVLAVGSTAMCGWMFAGAWMVVTFV